LDVSIQAQVLNLLVELRRKFELTYLFIAHDLGVVRYLSDRVGVMYLGKLVDIGPVKSIYESPAHPYTHALLSAIPIPDPAIERTRKRVILKGDVPSAAAPPSGCHFHTRCWLYERLGRPETCRTIEPQLRVMNENQWTACHYGEEAMNSPVGVVHARRRPPRRAQSTDMATGLSR
jgi:oligopeptide/dipeptide ABC transporter ATP-binding protein